MSTLLPAPWVFKRLLSFLGMAFHAMWFGRKQWGNPNLLPGVILLGSFTAPLVAAVFFFECNALTGSLSWRVDLFSAPLSIGSAAPRTCDASQVRNSASADPSDRT